MKTSDFDYHLPPEFIAQEPIEPRDHSRLMVVQRRSNTIEHHHFYELPDFLNEGDALVFNDSRVIPARLIGQREGGTGKVEVLLLRRLQPGVWEALAKPARRLRTESLIRFRKSAERMSICHGQGIADEQDLIGEVVESGKGGLKVIRLSDESLITSVGNVPLPPYIRKPLNDAERYQTVYAKVSGSAAAPTAGLHFTCQLLRTLEAKGIKILFVTLHIGLDTFRPVCEEEPEQHSIHKEYGEITVEAARQLNEAIADGRRIIAVGTTTVRLLEAVAAEGLPIRPFKGEVGLFILPGYHFRLVNAMITNFHLPRSTLLMLVSAFAGQKLICRAYQEAITRGYRFYSFGDSMLIF
jgi:S-adenosylmethionine:tRNA ribosyltransferase-isomerase